MAYYYYGIKGKKKGKKYGTKYGTVYNSKTLNGALAGAYKLIKTNPGWEWIVVRSQTISGHGDEYYVFRVNEYEADESTIVFYKEKPGKAYEEHIKYQLKADGTKGKRIYVMGDVY